MVDLLIVGGGIAGLTAALYAERAGKSALIFEKNAFGGQIASSPRVDNYPALPGVSGLDLADKMLSQALDAGAEIALENVSGLKKNEDCFVLTAGKKEFQGRAVIIAAGARHRTLDIPGEEALTGRGVSYCAVCDGAFFKGQTVAVVGGGSAAAQAALYLSGLCATVYVIHRREEFRCEKRELDALKARENIRFALNSRVIGLEGTDQLTGVVIQNTQSLQESPLAVTGLFVSVGQAPDNGAFAPMVELNENGFIMADERCETNVPGVFAAGDCRQKAVRQLTTAAADGTVAALAACAWLDKG